VAPALASATDRAASAQSRFDPPGSRLEFKANVFVATARLERSGDDFAEQHGVDGPAAHSVNSASTSAGFAAPFRFVKSPRSSIARALSIITCCVTRASPPPMEMRAAPSAPI